MNIFKVYWRARTANEQRLMLWAALVLLASIIYLSVAPFYKRVRLLDARIEQQEAQLKTLQALASQMPTTATGKPPAPMLDSPETLQAFALQQAQTMAMPTPTLNAPNAQQLQIQWTQVEFSKTLNWLSIMQNHGFIVESFNAKPGQLGLATVEIIIRKP